MFSRLPGACCLLFCSFAFSSGPFLDLSFEDALQRAKNGEKVVFIDFYTTWCGPCKMLDRTTWKDKDVISWLETNTVPLKIDAEKQVELAAKYKVQAYPTLLFVSPEGEALDRIVGFRDPEKFLASAREAIKGNPLERVAAKIREAEDPGFELLLEYADVLLRKEKYEQAFDQYTQIMKDHPPQKANPSFPYTQSIRKLKYMGKTYQPAADFIEQRYAELEQKVMDMTANEGEANELLLFNRTLRKWKENLAVFERYAGKGKDHPIAALFFKASYGQLLNARRFDEILAYTTPEAELEQAEKFIREQDEWLASEPEATRERMTEPLEKANVSFLSSVYQLYLGLKKTDEAGKIAEKILAINHNASTYHSMAKAGYLSGSPISKNLAQAQKANERSEGKDVEIIDTLARVLNALGQKGEAISVLDEAKLRFRAEEDLEKLEACRKALNEDESTKF